jgi:hypothetical protein
LERDVLVVWAEKEVDWQGRGTTTAHWKPPANLKVLEVVDYLDRLRATGAPEAVIEGERDGWILMAARWPEAIPAVMADKVAQLADPRIVRVYQLIGRIAENWEDEEPARETDLMSELLEQAAASGSWTGRTRQV